MLLLTSTTDKIQLITGQAVPVDVHVSYIDLAGGVVSGGRKNSKPSTATTIDICDPPAASTVRNVKTIHIQNIHASSSVTVTVVHTDGTNAVALESVTLLAGERLGYVEGEGFKYVDASGMVKMPQQLVPGQLIGTRLAADLANSTTTAAKVTGLDTVCGVGTWIFEYFVIYQTAITTTGIKFGVNHTGTVTSFQYDMMVVTANITGADALADQDVLLLTGGLVSAWAARAKSTSAPMITAGVDTATSDMLALIQGLAIVTVSGNLELYSASEVAASAATVKAGSCLRLTRVG